MKKIVSKLFLSLCENVAKLNTQKECAKVPYKQDIKWNMGPCTHYDYHKNATLQQPYLRKIFAKSQPFYGRQWSSLVGARQFCSGPCSSWAICHVNMFRGSYTKKSIQYEKNVILYSLYFKTENCKGLFQRYSNSFLHTII